MRSRDQRTRTVFGFEAMEARIALSGVGGGHHAHDPAEVGHARGADDHGVHHAADDHGIQTLARSHAGKIGDHGKHPAGHK